MRFTSLIKLTGLSLISLLIVLYSCNSKPSTSSVNHAVYIDEASSSCPYFTKDREGNIVLSWIRQTGDSSYVFSYAISTDKGESFQHRVDIPASSNIHPHAENIPKLLFKPSGEIIAVWGTSQPDPRNAYAGRIYYSQSFNEGRSWTSARKLVTDTAGYDQRYFDLTLTPAGEAAIIWLDNRKQVANQGSALYFSATKGNEGFTNEKLVANTCCECCRTVIAIDDDENIHVLYRAILNDSIRDMVHKVSTDGGEHFTTQHPISDDNWSINTCPHSGPSMVSLGSSIHCAWYTGGRESGIFYTHSVDKGNSFSMKKPVSAKGRHPQIIQAADDKLALVWDEPLTKADGNLSQILFELRKSDGTSLDRRVITADSFPCNYPVITAIDRSHGLIAFVQNGKEKRVMVSVMSYE